MAFEFVKGLFNPDRPVNVEKTVGNSNKIAEKLGNLKTDASVEHVQNLNKTSEALKNAKAAHVDAVAKGVGIDNAKAALREANKDAMKAIKAGKSHVRGAAYYNVGQKFGRFATNKFVAIPVLAATGLAATVGVASWIGNKRDEKARDSQAELRDQKTNSMRADVAALSGANTMMGMEPVVGSHAARVAAARNGGMGGVDPTNPIMHSSPDGRPIEIIR